MSLHYIDTRAPQPREHNLALSHIERRVEAALPELPSGGFAGRSQIDFERIHWISATECRLHYFYAFERTSGGAALKLDLTGRRPTLEIVSVTPRAEIKSPNQAMQLTASKPDVYAWSVCRRERMLRGMHRGLAAADLVSR